MPVCQVRGVRELMLRSCHLQVLDSALHPEEGPCQGPAKMLHLVGHHPYSQSGGIVMQLSEVRFELNQPC